MMSLICKLKCWDNLRTLFEIDKAAESLFKKITQDQLIAMALSLSYWLGQRTLELTYH